jgi:hypothetical protein
VNDDLSETLRYYRSVTLKCVTTEKRNMLKSNESYVIFALNSLHSDVPGTCVSYVAELHPFPPPTSGLVAIPLRHPGSYLSLNVMEIKLH